MTTNPAPKPRVLIVDDFPETLKFFGCLFESVGAEILLATNGEEAVSVSAQESKRDTPLKLILLDIHMPKMNGMSAARAIREQGFKGTIAAFTAVATGEWRKASMEAGVDIYFNKTVMNRDLIKALLFT